MSLSPDAAEHGALGSAPCAGQPPCLALRGAIMISPRLLRRATESALVLCWYLGDLCPFSLTTDKSMRRHGESV
ncbi:jg4411 [Pararge aegeria aegeria]|uniref:Jg4411 protein n=1 Tax=Pararge aegeria aegeria TaxID=348720 RepID=A0A8S4RNV6_9NEOP|nr:jg4411 [Pararge aegeria aegeria]